MPIGGKIGVKYSIFHCPCKEKKSHRLVFDGGSSGNYQVELCSKCYENQDKKFLINEENIAEIVSHGRESAISTKE